MRITQFIVKRIVSTHIDGDHLEYLAILFDFQSKTNGF